MTWLGWILVGLGGGGLLLGVLVALAHRRLYEGLRNEPFHREGDALAAYMPGCSRLVLAGGGLLLLFGVWLVRAPSSAPHPPPGAPAAHRAPEPSPGAPPAP